MLGLKMTVTLSYVISGCGGASSSALGVWSHDPVAKSNTYFIYLFYFGLLGIALSGGSLAQWMVLVCKLGRWWVIGLKESW